MKAKIIGFIVLLAIGGGITLYKHMTKSPKGLDALIEVPTSWEHEALKDDDGVLLGYLYELNDDEGRKFIDMQKVVEIDIESGDWREALEKGLKENTDYTNLRIVRNVPVEIKDLEGYKVTYDFHVIEAEGVFRGIMYALRKNDDRFYLISFEALKSVTRKNADKFYEIAKTIRLVTPEEASAYNEKRNKELAIKAAEENLKPASADEKKAPAPTAEKSEGKTPAPAPTVDKKKPAKAEK